MTETEISKEITWVCEDCPNVFDAEHPADYPNSVPPCPACGSTDTTEVCGVAI